MVFQLPDELIFPNPYLGEPNGLLAIGGDYSTDRLLLAYSNGIFPWSAFRNNQKEWYCPMQRFVIFPNEIHISHSMRTLINKQKYDITINKDFEGVIQGCSKICDKQNVSRILHPGAWIGDEIIEAYTRLFREGWAASVDVWDKEELVGGLYGVLIGNCFMGESMFSRVPNASKLALIALAQWMEENGGTLIDCQFETPHLKSMGGRFISYEEYMKYLNPNSDESKYDIDDDGDH